MEPIDLIDLPAEQPVVTETPPVAPSALIRTGASLSPQVGMPCATCGTPAGLTAAPWLASSPYIYALGRIEARFPNPSAEKEFAQAGGRTDTAGKPIKKPSTLFCPNGQITTWCANYVGC